MTRVKIKPCDDKGKISLKLFLKGGDFDYLRAHHHEVEDYGPFQTALREKEAGTRLHSLSVLEEYETHLEAH